jgi:hypothetical protein
MPRRDASQTLSDKRRDVDRDDDHASDAESEARIVKEIAQSDDEDVALKVCMLQSPCTHVLV